MRSASGELKPCPRGFKAGGYGMRGSRNWWTGQVALTARWVDWGWVAFEEVGMQQVGQQVNEVRQPVKVASVDRTAQRVCVREVDDAHRWSWLSWQARRVRNYRRYRCGGQSATLISVVIRLEHEEYGGRDEMPPWSIGEHAGELLEPRYERLERGRAQPPVGRETRAQGLGHISRAQALAPRLAQPYWRAITAVVGHRRLSTHNSQTQRTCRGRTVLGEVCDTLGPGRIGSDGARADLDVNDERPLHAVRQVLKHHKLAIAKDSRAVICRTEIGEGRIGLQLAVETVLACKVSASHRLGQLPRLCHQDGATLVGDACVTSNLILKERQRQHALVLGR
mmetsp:Transcript_20684/g.52695  ORF Transcript_20684/g.52695 Transcript_20684/m.52695 type:complete len:338 (+) Transcript_20684:1990-3003(+)